MRAVEVVLAFYTHNPSSNPDTDDYSFSAEFVF